MCQSVCQEVCVHYGEVCAFISEWVGVASRKPEGFGTCARTHSIGVLLHSFDFTPPCFSFQFICGVWFRFWARNVDLYFTLYFSSFFFFPCPFFFLPRKKYREGRRSRAEKCASLSLACALSLAHSLSSILSLPSRQKRDCSFPGHADCRGEHSSNAARSRSRQGI